MAEESIETPPTPKRTEGGRSHERRSETPPITPKKIVAGRGHERRGSTGMLDSPRSSTGSSAKIPSRYLQTSPSSCHDLCKYGTKHGVEAAKPRDSFRKMVTSKGGKMELLDQNSVASTERKNKLAISTPKASSDSRILQKPSSPVVIKEEVSSSTKEIDVSVENAGDLKLKSVQSKPFSSIQRNNEIRISRESPGSGSDSPRKGRELRTSKNMGEKKACLHTKHSTKKVSSMNTKNENNVVKIEPKQPSNDVVLEKTLYIIEASSTDQSKGIHSSASLPSSEQNSLTRTGSGFIAAPPFSSLSLGKKSSRHTGSGSARSSLSLSSSSFSPCEPSHSKENGVEKLANAEMEYKSRPRKGGKVSLDFKASPSRKLKFKRAKVVDLQLHSDQDNAPRRLKFKRSVRLVGESQNGKVNTRKSTKRRNYGRKEIGDIENGGKMKSEKVVLKHQNVERKQKDGRSLYNNVIEETARKLVVSRKSKVKALVGAFETVISLQDTRVPSVTTIAC
ncbi:uncharacterized protein LOC132173997 [Corylus avellana]|uniref:uncharacterized protein LOC132173997 n=1 Tax=Corylus avellana TaxID=13451 RepID=UPI00286BA372|nr:uncharacterized protein LOC132173997 [Corylus avellana]